MERDDWMGMGTSVAVHAVLLVLFAFLAAGRPQQRHLGVVRVQLGPFAEGRPVKEPAVEQPAKPAPETEEPSPQEEASDPETQPEQEQPAPKSKPVELPDQQEPIADEEQVETPEAETVAPKQPPSAEANQSGEPQPEQQAAAGGGGAAEGDDTGAAAGEDGAGADAEQSAPYAIEGLNREPVRSPLPRFVDKENVTLTFQITVSPAGRVVAARPVLKGNPALEREVQRVLQSWRFNPLPPGVPQEPQTGRVTFHFRVE